MDSENLDSENLDSEQWSSFGTSMLPFVLPGSKLEYKAIANGNIPNAGNIILYLDEKGCFVAHRVVNVYFKGDKRLLQVKGDAQLGVEIVEATAVLGVVSRVYFGKFSYYTDGKVGKITATLVLVAPQLVSVTARIAWRLIKMTLRMRRLKRKNFSF